MHPDEFYDKVMRACSRIISDRGNENEFRNEYWGLMSQNNWLNETFDRLTAAAAAYIELEFPNTNPRASVDSVILELVDEWVLMDLSAWVLSIPELERKLSDEVFQSSRKLADDRSKILDAIDRATAPRPSGRGPEGRYGERPVARSSGVQRERGGGGLFSNSRDDNQPQRRRGGIAAIPASGTRPSHQQEEEAAPAPVRREDRGQASDEFVAPSNSQSRGTRPKAPTGTAIDGPDYTKSRPYDQFFLEGEEWQLAHKSKWTLTWDASNPFPVAFNPRTHMRFYVRTPKGVIREEHLPMTEEMRYASHEYQGRVSRGQTVTRPLYDRAERGTGSPAIEDEEPETLESPAVLKAAGVVLDEVHPAILTQGSMEEAEMNAEFERRKRSNPVGVFHYVRAIPISVEINKVAPLENISECTNLTHAAEMLNNSMEQVDLALWNFLNDRFTTAVNHAVRKRFGLKAKIADFANDYQALVNWMKDKQGEGFARQFSQNTRYLIPQVTSRLLNGSAKAYITNALEITEEEFDAAPPPILVFEDRYSVMVVPFSSHDLGIKITDDSQMIGADRPKLQHLLEKFCENSNSKIPAACRYILTTDRLRIEVLQGGIDQSSYLLRRLG